MSLEIVLTDVQLRLARPEAADLRKIQHYAATRNADVADVSYIVKLYIETPPVQNSLGVELYVGDRQIRQYSQFKNGIYFKVNDPQQLADLQGREVRFRRPGSDEFINTGIQLPVAEAIDRNLRLENTTQLPTQAEVLQE